MFAYFLVFSFPQEDEDCTILQLEKDMRTRVEVMLKQKKERIQELKQLKQRDQELCDILCMSPYFIDSQVPSLDELDQFRRHLASLCAEKVALTCACCWSTESNVYLVFVLKFILLIPQERREVEFVKAKKQIILCMEELDRLPDTSFERDVVCVEEEAFCLSKENLEALHQLLFQVRWITSF